MNILLCDLDMTLCDNRRRAAQSLQEDGSINWMQFTDMYRIIQDEVLFTAVSLIRLLRDFQIDRLFYLTGREAHEPIILATGYWLALHHFPLAHLAMRDKGCGDPDHVMKEKSLQMLQEHFPGATWYALDDCGKSYMDSTPLQEMYQRHGVHLLDLDSASLFAHTDPEGGPHILDLPESNLQEISKLENPLPIILDTTIAAEEG